MDIQGDFIDWVESASQSFFTEKRLSTSDPQSKQLAESILVSAYSIGIKENTGCIQSAKRIADPIPNTKKVIIVGQSILAAICMGDKRPESPVLFALENGWIDVALHLVKTMPDDMINHFRDLDHLPESFWQTRGLSGENIAKRDQILSLLLEKTDAKWISQQLVNDKAGLACSYSAGFLQSTQLLQSFWEGEGARVPIDQGFVQPFINLLFNHKKNNLASVLLPFVQRKSFLKDSVLFSLLTHVAKEKGNADRALFRKILVQFRREARLMGREKEPEMKEAVYHLLCNTLDFCEEQDITRLLKIFGPLEDKWNRQNPVKQFVKKHFVQICQKGWVGTARKMTKHLIGMYTDRDYGNLVLGLLNIANPTDEVKKVTADLIKKFHESFGLIGFAVGQAMGVDNRV